MDPATMDPATGELSSRFDRLDGPNRPVATQVGSAVHSPRLVLVDLLFITCFLCMFASYDSTKTMVFPSFASGVVADLMCWRQEERQLRHAHVAVLLAIPSVAGRREGGRMVQRCAVVEVVMYVTCKLEWQSNGIWPHVLTVDMS